MGRILIIGDDLDIRQWLRAILESDGHDITGAEDGLEAIDLHKIKSFDLIITDIMMPKKSGFEVIKELKTSDPDLPIIVVYGGGLQNRQPNTNRIYRDSQKNRSPVNWGGFAADHNHLVNHHRYVPSRPLPHG